MSLLLLLRATSAALTPAERQQARISSGQEPASPQATMGPNGSLFTFATGAPHSGSVAWGWARWTLSFSQIAADGGVQTWDLELAQALRNTGYFTETKL